MRPALRNVLFGRPRGCRLYDSLRGMWEFEDSGNLGLDSHAYGNNLTAVNSPTQTTGKVSSGLQVVAASNQYLTTAMTPSLRTTGHIPFWCHSWVYFDDVSGNRAWACGADTNGLEWYVGFVTAAIRFVSMISGTNIGAVGPGAVISTWYSVFGWYDPDVERIYVSVDDAAAASAVVSGSRNFSSTLFRIGMVPTFPFNHDGRIDQVAVGVECVPTSFDRSFAYNGGSGRSYTEYQAYSQFQVVLWGLLDRLKKRTGRVPEPAVKRWLPRIPAHLRGRGEVRRERGYLCQPSGLICKG